MNRFLSGALLASLLLIAACDAYEPDNQGEYYKIVHDLFTVNVGECQTYSVLANDENVIELVSITNTVNGEGRATASVTDDRQKVRICGTEPGVSEHEVTIAVEGGSTAKCLVIGAVLPATTPGECDNDLKPELHAQVEVVGRTVTVDASATTDDRPLSELVISWDPGGPVESDAVLTGLQAHWTYSGNDTHFSGHGTAVDRCGESDEINLDIELGSPPQCRIDVVAGNGFYGGVVRGSSRTYLDLGVAVTSHPSGTLTFQDVTIVPAELGIQHEPDRGETWYSFGGVQNLPDGTVITVSGTPRVGDCIGADRAKVWFEVENDGGGENHNPVANFDAFEVEVGTSDLLDVLANDFDPDGDTFTLDAITAQPDQGSAVIEGDQVRFIAPSSGAGTETTFKYRIRDERGGTGEATVAVTLTDSAPTGCRIESGSYYGGIIRGTANTYVNVLAETYAYNCNGELQLRDVTVTPTSVDYGHWEGHPPAWYWLGDTSHLPSGTSVRISGTPYVGSTEGARVTVTFTRE